MNRLGRFRELFRMYKDNLSHKIEIQKSRDFG